MKKSLYAAVLAVAAAVSLGGCAPGQVADTAATAAGYQAKIAAACNTAMLVAPLVPAVGPWIIAGCGTEAAIAKLALDPTSLQWVNGLIANARL